MMRRFALALLCLALGSPAEAHPATNSLPDAGLAVVSTDGLQGNGRNHANFDAGQLSALEVGQVEHRFTLRNESDQAVTVARLEPSCHCTTAVVEKVAGREMSREGGQIFSLRAKEEAVIHVTVNLARQLPGPFSHGVFIYVNDHDQPVAQLEISGDMSVTLLATPDELDFGMMTRNTPATRKLTIAYDERLGSGEHFPIIRGDFDEASLQKDGAIEVTLESDTPSPDRRAAAADARLRIYRVTVRALHEGNWSGQMRFAEPAEDYHPGALRERALEALRSFSIPMRGQLPNVGGVPSPRDGEAAQ